MNVVESSLSPGTRRSFSGANESPCRTCGRPAVEETNGTDEDGRAWRQFAEGILTDPQVPRSDLEALKELIRDAAARTTEQTVQAIGAISPRFVPLAAGAKADGDRNKFLAKLAVAAMLIAAILTGSTTAAQRQENSAPVDVTAVSTPTAKRVVQIVASVDEIDADSLHKLQKILNSKQLDRAIEIAKESDPSTDDIDKALTSIGRAQEFTAREVLLSLGDKAPTLRPLIQFSITETGTRFWTACGFLLTFLPYWRPRAAKRRNDN